jgi:hypothetical protein
MVTHPFVHMLPIKPPSDFICGLKAYKTEPTTIMLSHSQQTPVQFPTCEFPIFVLIAGKSMVRC